jgi:hypothetical protein
MSYELKKLSESDWGIILRQSHDVVWLNQWLMAAISQEIFPGYIAKDSASDDYLMALPAMAGVDPERSNFAMFWRGDFCLIGLLGWSNKVVVECQNNLEPEMIMVLQDAIADAFFVYGRFGTGAFTRDGKPNLRVVPEFVTAK